MILALVVAPLALLVGPTTLAPERVAIARNLQVHMDASWRPKTVDPLGKAWGVPAKMERSYGLWLDLRTSEVTFAQQALDVCAAGARAAVLRSATRGRRGRQIASRGRSGRRAAL